MQESGKVGVIFSSLATHVFHPNLSTSLIFFSHPKSQFALSFFCCIWSPAAHFRLSLFFFLLPFLHGNISPSFHTENSSFFKEEIKQLALRFHLQSVWVSKLNLIWFCVFGYYNCLPIFPLCSLLWFGSWIGDSVLVTWNIDDIVIYWMLIMVF